MDKLDGRISEEYWLVKHKLWHDEKDKLVEKLHAMNNASRNFDEGSNFVYKDKEVSVELTSVFNYLLNNHFVNYGAGDEARTRDILLGKEAFYH